MPEARGDAPRRVVPVDPPVHVETFASHWSLTWTAGGLPRFVAAVGGTDAVPSDQPPVVDAVDTAGRERRALGALDPEATKYVRVDSPESWSLSWEQRTSPTVSLSGTPPEEVCRRVHCRTTDCAGWSDDDRRALDALLAPVR